MIIQNVLVSFGPIFISLSVSWCRYAFPAFFYYSVLALTNWHLFVLSKEAMVSALLCVSPTFFMSSVCSESFKETCFLCCLE